MMVLLLILLGCVAIAAGMFGLGVGMPVRDTEFGAAMVVSASVAFTGGLVLLGLAAAVSELRQALQAAAMRPVRVPERVETGSHGARRMEPRLGAKEPGGTFGETSDGDAAEVIPTRFDAPGPAERRRMPAREEWPAPDTGHARGTATSPAFPPAPDAAAEPRREPPGSPPLRPPAPGRFESIRPSDFRQPGAQEHNHRHGQRTEAPPDADENEGDLDSPPPPPGESPAPDAGRPIRILKSGIVNDVAYTFFSDGSIETQSPAGTQRFSSLDEFRRHLDKTA